MCIVKVGDILKDNDPRFPDRYIEIVKVKTFGGKQTFAYYEAGQRYARINVDRVFNDNKKRKTGFQLVSHGEAGLASGDGT